MFLLAAAAAAPAAPASGELPLNAFDGLVIVVGVIGILRGRARGISQDLLDLLMWIGIAVGGAFAYKPLGDYIAKAAGFNIYWSRVGVYVGVMVLCFIVTVLLKDLLRDKLASMDVFKSGEYPLGMLSGLIRFELMVVVACSLLHSDMVSAETIEAQRKRQVQELGQSFFPSKGEIQQGVFTKSMSGKYAKKYAPWLFIVGGPSGAPAASSGGSESVAKQREKELERQLK